MPHPRGEIRGDHSLAPPRRQGRFPPALASCAQPGITPPSRRSRPGA